VRKRRPRPPRIRAGPKKQTQLKMEPAQKEMRPEPPRTSAALQRIRAALRPNADEKSRAAETEAPSWHVRCLLRLPLSAISTSRLGVRPGLFLRGAGAGISAHVRSQAFDARDYCSGRVCVRYPFWRGYRGRADASSGSSAPSKSRTRPVGVTRWK
jgi:hypothetical protein